MSDATTIKSRLIDFSLKSPLINLRTARALKLNTDVSALTKMLAGSEGNLKIPLPEDADGARLRALINGARASLRTAGSTALYLSLGILKWKGEGEGFYFAPVSLLPVAIIEECGKTAISPEGSPFFNPALTEFLSYRFNIRTAFPEGEGATPEALLSALAEGVRGRQEFIVCGDIYLTQLHFSGYEIWRDLQDNLPEYIKNPIVAALLGNAEGVERCASESGATAVQNGKNLTNSAPPDGKQRGHISREIITPLPADSSQLSAISCAASGASFVLNGPPGTGKSQTIANIIANALKNNKSVLFVTEKGAAASVVKRRLEEAGIGGFCLNLHAENGAGEELLQGLKRNLSYAAHPQKGGLEAKADALFSYRQFLYETQLALNKKRPSGLSVNEGIEGYLNNLSAPDLVQVSPAFVQNLTPKRLADTQRTLTLAASYARSLSRFKTPLLKISGLTDCSAAAKNAALISARSLLAELRRFKEYSTLFAQTFLQRFGVFTPAKLSALGSLVGMLSSGVCNRFYSTDAHSFHIFYNAYSRYIRGRKLWLEAFKKPLAFSLFTARTYRRAQAYLNGAPLSRRPSRALKKLNRLSVDKLGEEGQISRLKLACEMKKDGRTVKGFVNKTCGARITAGARARLLKPLDGLYESCNSLFEGFNASAFNSACIRGANGGLNALYSGVNASITALKRAIEGFNSALRIEQPVPPDADVFRYYRSLCSSLVKNADLLDDLSAFSAAVKKLRGAGVTVRPGALAKTGADNAVILSSFRKAVYSAFVQKTVSEDIRLSAFSAAATDGAAEGLSRALFEATLAEREEIISLLVSRIPTAEDPSVEGVSAQTPSIEDSARPDLVGEFNALRTMLASEGRGVSVRQVFAKIPNLIRAAAPCLLMSPSTVSSYLPARAGLFDLVIFDEASQLPVSRAIPSVARGKSVIVAGDPNQLPPTDFFTPHQKSNNGGAHFPAQSEAQSEAQLTAQPADILTASLAIGMPERRLIFHYRSVHESLIAFSNAAYYSGNLCTVPPSDARGSRVKLKYIRGGTYGRGAAKCNFKEAEELCAEVVKRLSDPRQRGRSIGVVTFSTPQQLLIKRLLNKSLEKSGLLSAAYGGAEPLFIKSLEGVQGDERDTILFSVCYGPDEKGRLSLNFGPLNKCGGWRRLNVAVTRAREELLVFSSMRYTMIDVTRTLSEGVRGLRSFLRFAETGELGEANTAKQAKEASGAAQADKRVFFPPPAAPNPIAGYIAQRLTKCGYVCKTDVGYSRCKIGVAVQHPEDKSRYILGILCGFEAGLSVTDNFALLPAALRRGGWSVARVHPLAFFNDPEREVSALLNLLRELTSPHRAANKGYETGFKRAHKNGRSEGRSGLSAAYKSRTRKGGANL